MMPVIFVGHGSPMNAIEDNEFTKGWEDMAKAIPKPRAILSISAHWYLDGTNVMDSLNPKTIYDFYGFPKKLFEVDYSVKGHPELAHETKRLIGDICEIDNSWGIDHGTWSVLVKMYPDKDVPVFQLSIDKTFSPEQCYAIGKKISVLRESGVLILGSGNIVHNLGIMDWHEKRGYDWSYQFDGIIRDAIMEGKHNKILDYQNLQDAKLAVPITDHFYPLLYVLGACSEKDKVQIYNEKCLMGSISMTSYIMSISEEQSHDDRSIK